MSMVIENVCNWPPPVPILLISYVLDFDVEVALRVGDKDAMDAELGVQLQPNEVQTLLHAGCGYQQSRPPTSIV